MARVLDAVAQAAGGLVLVAARAVLVLQRRMTSVPRRGLTDDEWSVLEPVFGHSLDRRTIVVLPGRCGVLSLSPRPVTLGTTIVLKGDASVGTLVHEAVHVWQYRHRGPRYVVDAVRAQLSHEGYDWRGERSDGEVSRGERSDGEVSRGERSDGEVGRASYVRGVTRWAELNTEAQAQCVQDLHRRGAFADPPRDPVISGVSYAALAVDAAATLRAGHGVT